MFGGEQVPFISASFITFVTDTKQLRQYTKRAKVIILIILYRHVHHMDCSCLYNFLKKVQVHLLIVISKLDDN